MTNSPIPVNLGSYAHIDVNFGKFFKAVTKAGKAVFKLVIVLLYAEKCDSNDGQMPLEAFCTSVLKWSSGTFKQNNFNKSDREKLRYSPLDPAFDCDITLYGKIVHEILGLLPGMLREKLRKLRNLRNVVCHEDEEIQDLDLIERINELKSLCANILEQTGLFVQKDTSKDITDLADQLDDLVNAPVSMNNESLDSYSQFTYKETGMIIKQGRKELKKVYADLKVLNPCGWLNDDHFQNYTVENVFTVLRFSYSGEKVCIHDILNISNSVKTRFEVRVFILSGPMGSGKTSLCRYLVHEWCRYSNKIKGLRDFDLLLFINIRQVTSANLKQYIHEQLLRFSTRFIEQDNIVSILQNINTLFVIDGYDEGSVLAKDLVKEILTKFVDSTVVLTTRPEFVIELRHITAEHITIDVIGFDKDCIEEYVSKVMLTIEQDDSRRQVSIDAFLAYIFGVGQCLGDHLHLPLTITLLLTLWNDNQSNVTNVTSATKLYLEMFEMCRMKLIWRLQAKIAAHHIQVETAVASWYGELVKIAWQMSFSDTLVLGSDHCKTLIEAAQAKGLDPIETLSAFLNCTTIVVLTGTSYQFSFLHNSAVEFLASEHFASLVLEQCKSQSENGDEFCEELEFLKSGNPTRFKEMIIYAAGNLAEKNSITIPIAEFLIKCLVEYVKVSSNEIQSWYNLIVESSHNPAICHAVGAVICSTAAWIVSATSNYEISNLHLELLKCTFSTPSQVIVDIGYDRSASDIPHLQELLKLIAIRKRSLVKLYFEQQYNAIEETPDHMDTLVMPLIQSDSVVELKGHASAPLIKAIKETTKLEVMFLRVSSLNSLTELASYFKMFTSIPQYIFRKNKSPIRYLELFVDIPCLSASPCTLPRIVYFGEFVLKFRGVSDDNIAWYVRVISSLTRSCTTIIFLASTVSYERVMLLHKEHFTIRFREIMVHSSYKLEESEVKEIKRKKPTIRWYTKKTSVFGQRKDSHFQNH